MVLSSCRSVSSDSFGNENTQVDNSTCANVTATIASEEQSSPFILLQDETGETQSIAFDSNYDSHAKMKVWIVQAMEYQLDNSTQVYNISEPGTVILFLFTNISSGKYLKPKTAMYQHIGINQQGWYCIRKTYDASVPIQIADEPSVMCIGNGVVQSINAQFSSSSSGGSGTQGNNLPGFASVNERVVTFLGRQPLSQTQMNNINSLLQMQLNNPSVQWLPLRDSVHYQPTKATAEADASLAETYISELLLATKSDSTTILRNLKSVLKESQESVTAVIAQTLFNNSEWINSTNRGYVYEFLCSTF